MPCGACREFLYQLNEENESMEILVDYETRETVTLRELMPDWWGKERYAEAPDDGAAAAGEASTAGDRRLRRKIMRLRIGKPFKKAPRGLPAHGRLRPHHVKGVHV